LKGGTVAAFAGPDRDIGASFPAVPGLEFIIDQVGDFSAFDALAQPVTVAVPAANASFDAPVL
jgi:hypothetical protein